MNWWSSFRAFLRRNNVSVSAWKTTDADMEAEFNRFCGGTGEQDGNVVKKKKNATYIGIKVTFPW